MSGRLRRAAALALLIGAGAPGDALAGPGAAAEGPGRPNPWVEALLEAGRADCAAFDGTFSLAPGAVSEVRFAEDVRGWVVDEGGFRCTTAASLWCGSGGCSLHLIAGEGPPLQRQATGWRIVDWGPLRVVLLGRDGGWCGGAGAEVCVEALVWSAGRFLSLAEG